MIKSIYIRMLIFFLGSICISLVIGFFITDRLYKDHMTELIQDTLISNGESIIAAYEDSAPHNRDMLISGLPSLAFFSIQLYDQTGSLISNGDMEHEATYAISEEQLSYVLNGGVYRGYSKHGIQDFGVGLPFVIEGQHYAMFISFDKLEIESFSEAVGRLFKTQLFIVLLIGSLLIVASTRHIVSPIQHLTRATDKMAKGNFSIHLTTKREDEIGRLTKSFNKMAHELGMLESMRRQFVSDVSHEIQSPLTSIKGFTQALKNKKMDEASRVRLLSIIEEESNRLTRLSEDLLQLSSLEYEHLQLNISTYRLDEQIRKTLISLEPQWSAKNINIDIMLEEMFITADADKLSQVWANLIGNSIKFTAESGIIRVIGKESTQGIEISIVDSGQGIFEDKLNNIFKPFYKVDESRDRSISGNGIGLSIVKRVVDLHKGDIQVKSEVGAGTSFTVFLPK